MDKRINIWVNGKEVENNIKSIRSAMAHLTNQLNNMEIGSAEYVETSKKIRDLKAIYDEHCKSLKMTGDELEKNSTRMKDNVIVAGGLSATIQGVSALYQRFVSATQEYVDAYATLDDAMSAVQKTTGMTREEVEGLHKSLKSIDTRTSTNELLKIAEIGGRMGLAKDQIKGFTEAVNKANVALGDSFQGGAEEISSVLGKISLAYKETRDQDIGRSLTQIGSALNEVGASANATEGNIAAFVQRVGSMPEVFRPTVQQAVALGAAFEESSIDAEVASRAFGIVMMKASTNVEAFATAMGRPAEEIRNLINTNPAQFFVEFAASLKGMEATEAGAVLKDLKLNADGVNKIIGAMSTKTERFTEILNTSSTAFSEAISLDKEYAVVNENAAAQLEKAKKKMEDMKAELGKELIPILTQLYETLNKGAGWIKENINLVKALAIALGLWITTIGSYKAIQTTANTLLAITNGLHKAHRTALIASAAAQALFNKNLTRAQASTVLMKKELPLLTAALGRVKSHLFTIGKVFSRIVKASPVGWLAAVTGEVIKANREAKEGERIVKKLDERAHEALTRSMADIEAEKLKINQLRSIIHDETAAREEKLKAIKDIQSIVPGYVAELSEEGRVVRENTTAINDYIEAVSRSLQSDVIKEELRELYKQIGEKQAEVRKEKDLYYSTKLWDQIRAAWKGQWDFKGSNKERALYDLVEKATQLEEELKAIQRTSVKEKAVEKEEDDCTGDPETCQCEYHKQLRKEAQEAAKKEAEEKRKELIRQRKDFQKKLKKMREDEQDESLNEWEKVKTEIIRKYAEIEEEAAKLYGENSEMVKNVQEQKTDAIALAGQKYLKTTKDFVTKFSTEINQMLAETQGDTGAPKSRLVAAIAGSDKEWDKAITEAKKNAEILADILFDMDEEDPLWNNFATELAALQDQIEDADLKKAEARIAITKKFVEEETKGLQQREKEQQRQIALNKQGITEEQKAALQRQWKIDDLREEYDVEIKLMEAALKAAEANKDTEGIKNIEKMIEKLKELRDNVEATVDAGTNGTKKTGNALIDLLTGALTNPQERFRAVLDVMQDFANRAADIYQQIADAQQKSAELDMERFNEAQDAKARKLQQQLDEGLISQKYYDAQMEKMEAEKEQREKKMKHEQFERERKSAIVQALIQGGLAVARGFAEWGWPGGLIVGALTTAETAAQVALIASQVNPYAKGGYIRKKQLALVGEEGQEWVASNSLLEDKETAPVIAALDDYQRGNRNAMRLMAPTQPAWKNLSQSASQISSTFASNRTPVVHHHYQTAGGDELLKEVKQMNQFLADPKNRQAYISYKIQTEAQKNRDFIKQAAKL